MTRIIIIRSVSMAVLSYPNNCVFTGDVVTINGTSNALSMSFTATHSVLRAVKTKSLSKEVISGSGTIRAYLKSEHPTNAYQPDILLATSSNAIDVNSLEAFVTNTYRAYTEQEFLFNDVPMDPDTRYIIELRPDTWSFTGTGIVVVGSVITDDAVLNEEPRFNLSGNWTTTSASTDIDLTTVEVSGVILTDTEYTSNIEWPDVSPTVNAQVTVTNSSTLTISGISEWSDVTFGAEGSISLESGSALNVIGKTATVEADTVLKIKAT